MELSGRPYLVESPEEEGGAAGGVSNHEVGAKVQVDPYLESAPVSKFDCEKRTTSLSNLNLVFLHSEAC